MYIYLKHFKNEKYFKPYEGEFFLQSKHFKRLNTSWSLYKHLLIPTAAALLFSLIAYLYAWHFSQVCKESMIFSRSGGIGIIISILVFPHLIKNPLKKSENDANELLKKITDLLPITGKEQQKRIETQTAMNTRKILNKSEKLLVISTIIATAIWAFGDLVAKNFIEDITVKNPPCVCKYLKSQPN